MKIIYNIIDNNLWTKRLDKSFQPAIIKILNLTAFLLFLQNDGSFIL